MNRGVPRVFVVTLVAVLLTSCSAMRLAYNNSEALVRFEADEYFDLDEAQALDFRERLARYHAWHRDTELPAYVTLLETATAKVSAGVTPQDVTWAIAALRSRYQAAVVKALKDGAPILGKLRAGQIRTMEKKFAESNRKFEEEFLKGEERRLLRGRTKRMWERFRDWIGHLTDEQEARIERFVRDHSRYTLLRFEDRKRWQREAASILRQTRDPAELAARLTALVAHPEKRRSAEYLTVAAQWETDLTGLVSDIDRMLMPEQRARLIKRIEGFADDYRVLAGKTAPTQAASIR